MYAHVHMSRIHGVCHDCSIWIVPTKFFFLVDRRAKSQLLYSETENVIIMNIK